MTSSVPFRMLKLEADGSFNTVNLINDGAYKIDLPSDHNIFATFNIFNLLSYYEEQIVLVEGKTFSTWGE